MEQEQAQQEEFTALGEQIKQQIYQLISFGKTIEAQQILGKLRTLTPNDRELDELEEKLSAEDRLKELSNLSH